MKELFLQRYRWGNRYSEVNGHVWGGSGGKWLEPRQSGPSDTRILTTLLHCPLKRTGAGGSLLLLPTLPRTPPLLASSSPAYHSCLIPIWLFDKLSLGNGSFGVIMVWGLSWWLGRGRWWKDGSSQSLGEEDRGWRHRELKRPGQGVLLLVGSRRVGGRLGWAQPSQPHPFSEWQHPSEGGPGRGTCIGVLCLVQSHVLDSTMPGIYVVE